MHYLAIEIRIIKYPPTARPQNRRRKIEEASFLVIAS